MTPEDHSHSFYSLKASRITTIAMTFMALGTLAELFLLEHYEDSWQLIPIVLIALSIVFFLVLQWSPSTIITKVFKGLMIACGMSGVLGSWLHLKANMEFEAELHPSYSFLTLITNSFSGAFPALAPGSMIVFGLIGYLYITLTAKQFK
ncbi:MAG: hypothetical protein AAF363_07530 [Bacteroidota bacterium]